MAITHPDQRIPSQVTTDPWVYAESPTRHASPPFLGSKWSGKWLLFIPAPHADQAWLQVRNATVGGNLGTGAKCATRRQPPNAQGTVVICVYTADCRNLDDVRRVLSALRNLGYQGRLNYKEDLATRAGLYQNDSTPASLYTSPAGLEIKTLRPVTVASPDTESQDRYPNLPRSSYQTAQAEIAAEIADGRLALADALDDDRIQRGVCVVELLAAVPGVGTRRARRILRDARIDPGKLVSGLGTRQRAAVIDAANDVARRRD